MNVQKTTTGNGTTKSQSTAARAKKTPRKTAAKAKPRAKTRARKPPVPQAQAVPGPTVIDLQSRPGIAGVKLLHSTLIEVLDKKSDIIFQASNIETIDTAMLQLLGAFVTQAHQDYLDVSWDSPSEALLEAARLLDLEQQLDLMTNP